MKQIKAISQEDIHSITSGQVITDVNSIIKELLENSIDADSKNIEITLKDYCLNGIEIKDDGHGIQENDFDTICLKHYTSKIKNFEDINTNLVNLGFRGEALNSICFISNTTIMTCTNDEDGIGHELHYNNNGDLIKQDVISMDKGTIIQIEDIFKNLPVRRLNFENLDSKVVYSELHNYKVAEEKEGDKGKEELCISKLQHLLPTPITGKEIPSISKFAVSSGTILQIKVNTSVQHVQSKVKKSTGSFVYSFFVPNENEEGTIQKFQQDMKFIEKPGYSIVLPETYAEFVDFLEARRRYQDTVNYAEQQTRSS